MRIRSSTLRGSLVKVRLRHASGKASPSEPADDWHDVLEWAEKQGTDSLKSRFATAEIIAKEAQATLTVLLAGIGGSAAYAAKLFEPGPGSAPTWGFAVACVYLIGCGLVLIARCMTFQSYPAMYQEPVHLTQKGYSLDALKEVELENLSERIREAKAINDRRARTLNAVRLAAALTPLVFGAAAICAYPSQPKPKALTITVTCATPGQVTAASQASYSCKVMP